MNKYGQEKRVSYRVSDTPFYHLLDKAILYGLVAAVIVFVLYPLLCIVKKSMVIDGSFTLSEYENLFTDNWTLMKNSLFTASWSAVLSTTFGVLIAIKIAVTKGRLRLVFMGILLMTMVSPPFISSLVYIQLYGRRGWITYHLLELSLNPYNKWGVIAMQSIHFASLNALFTAGILDKLDHNMIFASRDLGASPAKTFRHVVFPLIRPAIFVCFLLSFIRSMADFGTPMVIGGRYNTLATEIYMQLVGYSRLEKASAMNMLLLIPAVLVFAAYRYLMKKSDSLLTASEMRGGGGVLPAAPEGVPKCIMNLMVYFFYLMMVLQYLCIFFTGFLKSKKGVYYFSLDHFDSLMKYNMDSLWRSVEYSLAVAFFGTAFAMLLSYYMDRRKIRMKGSLDFVATLPYLLPGTCFGIGYILAFNKAPLKLTGTAAIIILNMVFKQLPTVTKMTGAALAQLNTKIEDAARDLGAGKYHVMKDIVFPNLKQTFATGFIYNFTSSMTTAGAVLFLISANHKMAVYTLFDAINSGEYGVASLISSMIILITLGVSGLVQYCVGNCLRRK